VDGSPPALQLDIVGKLILNFVPSSRDRLIAAILIVWIIFSDQFPLTIGKQRALSCHRSGGLFCTHYHMDT